MSDEDQLKMHATRLLDELMREEWLRMWGEESPAGREGPDKMFALGFIAGYQRSVKDESALRRTD